MTQETPETRLALLEDAFRRVSGTLTSIESILTGISQQLADKAVDSARVRTEVFGRLGHIEEEQRTQNDHLSAIDSKLTEMNKKIDDHENLDKKRIDSAKTSLKTIVAIAVFISFIWGVAGFIKRNQDVVRSLVGSL